MEKDSERGDRMYTGPVAKGIMKIGVLRED